MRNIVDQTRRVNTIPRNTTRYAHDSLAHCESSIKEVEKQIRVFIAHTWRAHHKCDSDRHVAGMSKQCIVNAEEPTSLSKWMSKDYRGEVAKFVELSWFHSIAKQSKLAEQWKDVHWVRKLKRADEQLLGTSRIQRWTNWTNTGVHHFAHTHIDVCIHSHMNTIIHIPMNHTQTSTNTSA